RLPRADVVIELGGHGVNRVGSSVWRIIEGVCNQVDIVEREPDLAEAETDGADRKTSAVFLAVEALFGGCGHRHAVDDERRGGIKPLGDPVFPFVKARPMSLFEGHSMFQTA